MFFGQEVLALQATVAAVVVAITVAPPVLAASVPWVAFVEILEVALWCCYIQRCYIACLPPYMGGNWD